MTDINAKEQSCALSAILFHREAQERKTGRAAGQDSRNCPTEDQASPVAVKREIKAKPAPSRMIVRPIRSAPSSRDEIDPRRATTRAYPCQPRSLLLGLDHAPPLRETVPSVQAPDPHRPVRLELTRRPAQCTVTARAALVRDPIHPSARRTGHDEPSVRSLRALASPSPDCPGWRSPDRNLWPCRDHGLARPRR